MSVPTRFSAFHKRDFRLFFTGQILSVSGTWMQRVAEGWLAYRLTESPLMLGAVVFAGSSPALLFSPIAGVLADQVNRRRLFQLTQALTMLQALTLAVFTFTGWITPSKLLGLALLAGIVRSFENPARHSLLSQLVPVEDLANAIFLNSTVVNLARIVGPVFAGFIVAGFGEGLCFLVNGLSFLVPIVCLQLIRTTKAAGTEGQNSPWESLREGFGYVRKNLLLRHLLFLLAVTSFLGAPYMALLPVLAGTVLGVDATGFSWMVTATGIGALICSAILAAGRQAQDFLKLVLFASLLFGSALVCLAVSRTFYLTLAILPFVGAGFMLTLIGTQIPLQTLVPDELRGRVMSFYSLVFLGLRPVGSLLEGWVAESIGVPTTVGIGGLSCLAASLFVALRFSKIRNAGIEMGVELEKRRSIITRESIASERAVI